MNFRTFLFIVLITFSMNTVAQAADLPIGIGASGFDASDSFPVEYELPFQYALDMGMVNYPPVELEAEPKTYKVMEGDNLFRIALKHNIPLESLVEWNNLAGDVIHPGKELIVSGGVSVDTVHKKPDRKVATVSSPIVTPPPVVVPEVKEEKVEVAEEQVVNELLVTATAYTAYCTGCSGTTAYGIDLRSNPNQKVIAVDPRIIPLGTKVWVEGYGEAIAGDTGGAIKGHKIDVFIPSYDSAMEWGVKKVKLKVLN
ncbi:LysM peptidoglycan-binding and 3D domain-containing protein [Psychrobacillus sp. OK032]|uniref:LysM peptidoglycan-binding and 3D domain-containing protein n=1 Tax=Psychrobacillus sp. OK032 TaxID=1884358 RepID=UPI0026F4102F|nr:LysM peptidoglycan-binding and 3D domain-containing protein [Psychrobacillus sp. OK032]